MPRTMMAMFMAQKMAKLSHIVHGWRRIARADRDVARLAPGPLPRTAPISMKMASPPIQVWMPNQPQATPARMSAGRLAPNTPNEARAKTGNGMPYLVPAWLLARIGSSTMMLPSMIVRIAWYQAMPEGDQAGGERPGGDVWAMPTQSAT